MGIERRMKVGLNSYLLSFKLTVAIPLFGNSYFFHWHTGSPFSSFLPYPALIYSASFLYFVCDPEGEIWDLIHTTTVLRFYCKMSLKLLLLFIDKLFPHLNY